MPTEPWGSGPPSWPPQQPDLAGSIQRSQEKLRTWFSGGNFGRRGFGLVALAGVAIWAFSGFFRVQADEQGVVLRFGKVDRVVQSGLNY